MRVLSFVQVRKHLTHVFEHLEYIGWVGLSQSQKETKSKPYKRIIKLYGKSKCTTTKLTSKHELISEEQSRVEIEHDVWSTAMMLSIVGHQLFSNDDFAFVMSDAL